jgi:hypothetical protein
MGEKRNTYRILAGKSEAKGHLEDLCVNGKIILKCTFKATGWEYVDRIHVAPSSDMWRAVVSRAVESAHKTSDSSIFKTPTPS